MTDLLTTLTMNKEIDNIVGRAVRENLMTDEFTRTIDNIIPLDIGPEVKSEKRIAFMEKQELSTYMNKVFPLVKPMLPY